MTTTLERYTTTAGEVIEYPGPSPDVARYLARVLDAAHDPRVSEGELVELVYSKDNPIMDATIFPGRGAVTRAVFANPIYQVMHDLLFAKRLRMEHAERSGEALRGSSRRGPESESRVAELRDAERNERREGEAGLRIRMGNAPGYSLRVKAADLEVIEKVRLEDGGRATTAIVSSFERVAVAISGKEMNRMFVLEPADEPEVFNFGPFAIEGHFRVVEKVNAPAKAAAAWKGFKAS